MCFLAWATNSEVRERERERERERKIICLCYNGFVCCVLSFMTVLLCLYSRSWAVFGLSKDVFLGWISLEASTRAKKICFGNSRIWPVKNNPRLRVTAAAVCSKVAIFSCTPDKDI